jgi:tetratricopeptide (TPR) repeat protein
MPNAKECFLIMPIRKPGSEEYDHFRALRDTVLEPVFYQMGYNVSRADDIAKSGAITADILARLATADLVVADLTNLNPNVFYELGVRHTLRGQGTIMIVDTSRTAVPFDLAPYRVIEFTPDLRGIEKLREMLSRFASAIAGDVVDPIKDNPVHDYLRSLPDDIYAHASGSTEGELRQEIAQLRERLRNYAERFGGDLSGSTSSEAAADIITVTLMQAQRGELPVDLLRKAHAFAREENRTDFLSILRQLITEKPSQISADSWSTLASDALDLELEDVALVLYDQAIELRPQDETIKRYQLVTLAHSGDPNRRARGRAGLASLLGIKITDEGVFIPPLPPARLSTIGVMLDAYHHDGLNEEALRVTTVLSERYPYMTVALRNHARALELTGHDEEAIEHYDKAMQAPDVDDTTANWYGNMLASDGKTVEATIKYLDACLLDPDDAHHYIGVAIQTSSGIADRVLGRSGDGGFPESIDSSTVCDFVTAAFSCPVFTADLLERARVAFERVEVDMSLIEVLIELRRGVQVERDIRLFSRADRVQLVRAMSNLMPPAAA